MMPRDLKNLAFRREIVPLNLITACFFLLNVIQAAAEEVPPWEAGSSKSTEIKQPAATLPPCPASESERTPVSPFYFALCAERYWPKPGSAVEAEGAPAFPPRPDYLPKELPPCPTWTPNSLVSPYYPCPGQKLGLPKADAETALSQEIRQLLDSFLRLYREEGLLTNRHQALAAINVGRVERRWHSRYTNMPIEEPTHFTDDFAKEGLFARPGLRGSYHYGGWQNNRTSWYVSLEVAMDYKNDCVSSRAVEGYLDLFLQTGLTGRVHPEPPKRWYRHGEFGRPYALPINHLTPTLGMVFSSGCLVKISVGKAFEYNHIGDDDARN